MLLINKYLSEFHFNEIHAIQVNCTLEECYNAMMELDLENSKIIKFLFKLRGLPFGRTKLNEITNDMRFTLLEENKHNEFLYAFWFKHKTEWITDKEIFLKNNSNLYHAKVGWSFLFTETVQGFIEIRTETRVYCLNKKTKIFFAIYWFFIKPFSEWIRLEMLRLVKLQLENKC
jgi:hypothetical protein